MKSKKLGDLAEFGKKRDTDYDFPPPLYVGGNNNKQVLSPAQLAVQIRLHVFLIKSF